MVEKLDARLDIDVTIAGDTLLRFNPNGLALLITAINAGQAALADQPGIQAALVSMLEALVQAADDVGSLD